MELTGFDVRAFLAEDIGDGDLTTESVVPADARLEASLLLKERGVVCALEVAESVFRELDSSVVFERFVNDGDETQGEVARVSGNAARAAERRAHGAEPARPPVRDRDAHPRVRRRGRRDGRDDPRHAQDDAGPARAREVRGTRRRRHEPPLRALRRRFSSRTTTCVSPAASRRPYAARRGKAFPSRSSARRSRRFARRWRRARTSSCSTTCRCRSCPRPCCSRRPREDGGIGRRDARRPFAQSPRRASTSFPSEP